MDIVGAPLAGALIIMGMGRGIIMGMGRGIIMGMGRGIVGAPLAGALPEDNPHPIVNQDRSKFFS